MGRGGRWLELFALLEGLMEEEFTREQEEQARVIISEQRRRHLRMRNIAAHAGRRDTELNDAEHFLC